MKKSEMRDLATRALRAAMREDWPAVQEVFGEISTDGRAVTFALMAWCDTTIMAQDKMLGSTRAGLVGRCPEMGASGMGSKRKQANWSLTLDEMPPAARVGVAHDRRTAPRWTKSSSRPLIVRTVPGDRFKRGELREFARLLRSCAGIVEPHLAGWAVAEEPQQALAG